MFYSNTLNLIQVGGGTQVKQGDLGSKFSYKLANENDQELDDFDKEVAHINLVLDDKIVFTTTATVDNSTVTFNIDKAIPIGLYFLEIKIRDYIFPSDKQTIIFVQSGAVAYDLKELVPNYDTNMTLKGILSDLSQKGIDISDLKRQLAEKANKDEVTNVMTPKGNIAYASLPKSGNQVGWYYYCPDGDGTHGAGNYVWNGTSWFFGGTGDEGYNLLKKDLVNFPKIENALGYANIVLADANDAEPNSIYRILSNIKEYMPSNLPTDELGYLVTIRTKAKGYEQYFWHQFYCNESFNICFKRSKKVVDGSGSWTQWEEEKNTQITPYDTTFFDYGKNLINTNEVIKGKYSDYATGVIGTNDSFCYCMIPVEANTDYIIKNHETDGLLHIAFFRDKNNTSYISGVLADAFTTPENANYASISFPITSENIWCNKTTEYKKVQIKKEFLPSNNSKIIKVEKDGSGDFTKLIDALAYGMEHPYTTIYLGSGEYNLIEEHGNDYFNNFVYEAFTGMGPIIGNGTHLICSPKSKITCHYTGNNEQVMWGYSPLNPSADNSKVDGFVIEGATIEASNVRYCVHDDIGIRTTPYKHEYKRCKMNLDNSRRVYEGSLHASHHCIGGGMGICGDILIEDCYFSGQGDAGDDKATVAYHNDNYNQPSKGSIVIRNSYFAENSTIEITDIGANNDITKVMISGNSLGSNIIRKTLDEEATGDMDVYEWNNEVRQ